ncbi:multidrug effflux MFS transporter [Zobellia barbeyronii]|uniref:Multidrug effflux MFS transporter n=1 Tax=Zobellia barbeyronii TaxID=2748009 RepID=A0ABS5WAX2_9FLAO|nr:multidrug effflux MFS transporter [Zobellia barbeyronii]MBT2160546.1 multidrug effflux MFS transporter [Zobellia barbeyronii]
MERKKISELEFIGIMASLMALASLSIDALLPGLNEIANSIGITNPKDNQLLITTIFLGLGFGQLISGTLSDSIGRKPIVYIGYIIFVLASILCIFSTSLEMMLVGRLLQGIGLSAPRSVSMSIIRDKYSGDYMARIMSFVTVVFILAPVIAPTFGKIMLDNFGWESIFLSQLIFGLIAVVWLWRRQPETLTDENKKEVRLSLFTNGIKEFLKHKSAVINTLIIGIISAPFLAYISASQHIFEGQYNLGDVYPYIFSGLALGIGLATYLNGILVVKYGMYRLSITAIIALLMISGTYSIFFNGVNPSSTILIIFLALILFATGFIVGNLNALAMQPIGHIAGIGAALIGFASTILTVVLATLIGRYVDETALPIFAGFAVCSALSLGLILIFNLSNENVKFSLKESFE